MIQIPNTPALQQTTVGMPNLDESAAAAPVRALGPLAQGIAALGEHFQAVAVKTQGIENARMESEARNKLATDYSQFQLDLQSEQDPAQRLAKTQAFLATAKGGLVTSDMPPVVRERLALHADEFSAHASIAAGADAAALAEKRGDEAANNEIETSITAGNAAGAHAAIDRLAASGHKTPEELEAMRHKVDYHLQYQDVQRAVMSDPLAGETLVNNPDFLKTHDRLTPEAQMTLQREAKMRVREKTADMVATLQDGMASPDGVTPPYIATQAQIYEIGAGLHPAVLQELSGQLSRSQSLAEQARRATPEYQDLTAGQVSAAIASYNPVAEGYDLPFTRIDGQIRSLPEGAIRAELEKNLKDKQKSVPEARNTLQKLAMGAIDDAAKAGHFGNLHAMGTDPADGRARMPGEVTHKTATFIDTGFLRNPSKIGALGYGDAQASLISDPVKYLKDSKDKAGALVEVGLDTQSADTLVKQFAAKKDGTDYVPTDKDREELFRLLWEKRKNPGTVTAPPFDLAIADAIHQNDTSFQFIDPEKQDAAITERDRAAAAVGKAKTEMLNYLQTAEKSGQKVTVEDVQKHLYEVGGESPRLKLQQSSLPGPARAPGAAGAPPVAANLTDLVKGFESDGDAGWKPQAFWDSKQWSIGYGTKSKQGETITHAEADKRLATELAMHRGRVEAANDKYGLNLTANEADALTSFDFNTGALGQLLDNGTRSRAEIAAAMPLYRNAGGQRMPGLETRRAAEVALFLKGYAGKGRGGPAFVKAAVDDGPQLLAPLGGSFYLTP